jgi:hypothetical protein
MARIASPLEYKWTAGFKTHWITHHKLLLMINTKYQPLQTAQMLSGYNRHLVTKLERQCGGQLADIKDRNYDARSLWAGLEAYFG